MALFPLLLTLARSFFAPRMELMAEILALRQQLAILNRTTKRPSLRFRDRLFWIALASFWQSWRSALLIVKPETAIKWRRQCFRLYWRWKSKARHPGRPRIGVEIRNLIRRLSEEGPLWGTPCIQAKLHLLGLEVAKSTVAKYRINTTRISMEVSLCSIRLYRSQLHRGGCCNYPPCHYSWSICWSGSGRRLPRGRRRVRRLHMQATLSAARRKGPRRASCWNRASLSNESFPAAARTSTGSP